MSFKRLLQILSETAAENGINTPYIVGGIPRDILLNVLENLNDVDITTGGSDVHQLADLFAQKLGVEAKTLKDGHKKVVYNNISIDFSSNFMYDNIDSILKSMGITDINNLVRETYSRDFTINTLLIPLDFSRIIDITNMGVDDVENKVLRCPVRCSLAFKASPMRIIRSFYYMAKFDLKMPENMRRSIINSLEFLDSVDDAYKAEKINYALQKRPDLINDLIEMGVLHKIPLNKELSQLLINNKRLTEVL